MADIVPFTDNYVDLSNDSGYQFEFRCERCGNGYRSPFQADKLARGRGLLRMASSLSDNMGIGRLGRASDSLLDRATGSAAKDKALGAAVEAVRPHFQQCRGCGDWVCKEVCWNHEIGQCVNCSPIVAEELSRAQARAQVEQLQEKTREVDWTADLDLTTRAKVTCPHCGAAVAGGKFCGECGGKLRAEGECSNCGTPLNGAKFCSECGQKA